MLSSPVQYGVVQSMKASSWRRLGRPSLHTSVLAGVIAVGLLVVGLDCWRTWQERSLAIEQDKVATANLARSLAQHAHDMIQSADAVLVGLRERVEIDGLSPSRIQQLHDAMAARVAGLPKIHSLFVIDAQGNRVTGSLPAEVGSANYFDRAYFQYHRTHADRDVHVGSPVRSRSDKDNDWVITVTRRLDTADGTFRGVLLVTIAVDTLQRFYSQFDVGAQGAIALETLDGTMIALQPVGAVTTGADISKGPIHHDFLPRAPTGSLSWVSSLDGVVRLGSYRKVEDYPLVVVAARTFDDVLANWRAQAYPHAAVSLGSALALILLGSRFARQIKAQQQVDRRYRLLADNSSDAIICVALDGRRLYVSPAFSKLTGWSIEDALQAEWGDLIHPDDRQSVLDVKRQLLSGAGQVTSCFRYICKDGSALWVEARMQMVSGDAKAETQFLGNIRDITERKNAQDQVAALNRELSAQANTDALTGLANRRRFDEAIDVEWRRAAREENPLSLLMIDVDRFKSFNDRYGHQQGDRCLRSVASAIADCARRPGDVAARYGGEEIVVLLPCTSSDGAAELAWRVRAAVEVVRVEHRDNLPGGVVTVSIGVATLWPDAADTSRGESLLATADAALYEAKRGGRNQVVVSGATDAEAGAGKDVAPAETAVQREAWQAMS